HVVGVQLAAALSAAAAGVIVSLEAGLPGVSHVHGPSVLHAFGGNAAFPVVTLLAQVRFAQLFARSWQRTLAEFHTFLFQPAAHGYRSNPKLCRDLGRRHFLVDVHPDHLLPQLAVWIDGHLSADALAQFVGDVCGALVLLQPRLPAPVVQCWRRYSRCFCNPRNRHTLPIQRFDLLPDLCLAWIGSDSSARKHAFAVRACRRNRNADGLGYLLQTQSTLS